MTKSNMTSRCDPSEETQTVWVTLPLYLKEPSDDSVQDVPLGFPAHAYGPNQVLVALRGLSGWWDHCNIYTDTRWDSFSTECRRAEVLAHLGGFGSAADVDHYSDAAALFAQVPFIAVIQQNIWGKKKTTAHKKTLFVISFQPQSNHSVVALIPCKQALPAGSWKRTKRLCNEGQLMGFFQVIMTFRFNQYFHAEILLSFFFGEMEIWKWN